MLFCLSFLILFSSALGETGHVITSSHNNAVDETSPITVKLSTTLDIRIRNDQNKTHEAHIQLHSPENIGEQSGSLNEEQSFGQNFVELSDKIQNIQNAITRYNDNCKTLVGVSRTTICPADEDLQDFKQFNKPKKVFPRSCREIHEQGNNSSGIYEIRSRFNSRSMMVLCDMETRGGGWLYIQKRFDGSEDFYRNWRDYKFGFGNLKGEFWMGLETIYQLTGFETSELLVELTDTDQRMKYAQYTTFAIESETKGYNLSTINGFSGTAKDALIDHVGLKFSTKDFDQDTGYLKNCAELSLGGWWYDNCYLSNLNGKFINLQIPQQYFGQGAAWDRLGFLSGTKMLVRPRWT